MLQGIGERFSREEVPGGKKFESSGRNNEMILRLSIAFGETELGEKRSVADRGRKENWH